MKYFALLIALLSWNSMVSQTIAWTGAQDAFWNNPNNWNPVREPNAFDFVSIDNATVSVPRTVIIEQLELINKTELNIEAGVCFTIDGSTGIALNMVESTLINNGSLKIIKSQDTALVIDVDSDLQHYGDSIYVLDGSSVGIKNQGMFTSTSNLYFDNQSSHDIYNEGVMALNNGTCSGIRANNGSLIYNDFEGEVTNNAVIQNSKSYLRGIANYGKMANQDTMRLNGMLSGIYSFNTAEFENTMSGYIEVIDTSWVGLDIRDTFTNKGIIIIDSAKTAMICSGSIVNEGSIQITNANIKGLTLDDKFLNSNTGTITIRVIPAPISGNGITINSSFSTRGHLINEGHILIEDTGGYGISSEGIIENLNSLQISNALNTLAIFSKDSMINGIDASIQINNCESGIAVFSTFSSKSTFINKGKVNISNSTEEGLFVSGSINGSAYLENYDTITIDDADVGLLLGDSLYNHAAGLISISNIDSRGIGFQPGTLYNDGHIQLTQVMRGTSETANNGKFVNNGLFQIFNFTLTGITIGTMEYINGANGTIEMEEGSTGVWQSGGSFQNYGQLEVLSVNVGMYLSNGEVINHTAGNILIQSYVNNSIDVAAGAIFDCLGEFEG